MESVIKEEKTSTQTDRWTFKEEKIILDKDGKELCRNYPQYYHAIEVVHINNKIISVKIEQPGSFICSEKTLYPDDIKFLLRVLDKKTYNLEG